jgi:hypothetical protein
MGDIVFCVMSGASEHLIFVWAFGSRLDAGVTVEVIPRDEEAVVNEDGR